MSHGDDSQDDRSAQATVKIVCSTDIDSIIEAVRAADTLGMGVRLTNHLEPTSPTGADLQWQLTVLKEPPGRAHDLK
ncbi:hypothetical protein [Nonomuraea endophytica]|uniref:Uncharacterized protein n=1 Tax=Nonomuraea endophytica TaxID=714136 RepID=A0A7W7ZX30_9ACTN|nr:hypothetical protein [Nonomuraea endophytica]MBB5075397.1 hypothetical protein [Nonomuraea endophytica]